MDSDFWHERWENNELGFHRSDANPFLIKHLQKLEPSDRANVFVPLCGKTLDIAWLLEQGYRVTGAELVQLAVEQLFDELGVTPEISKVGAVSRYSAKNVDIYVGDIFEIARDTLGPVDVVYDRAALVAMPEAMRARYTSHLSHITATAPQLLVTFEYDQSQLDGPPFSVPNTEVIKHYDNSYELTLLETAEVAGGLKGQCPAKENVWKLSKK